MSRVAPLASPRSLQRRGLLTGLVALGLLGFGRPSRADDDLFRYRGREYAPTGSNVTRRLNWTGKLPFDRTYAELSAAQKAEIRDQYNGLAASEEPPFPQGGLRAIFRLVDESLDPTTPRLSPGSLLVVAKVDARGDVQGVNVYKAPNPFIQTAVSQALLKTPFKPASRDGAPVAMDFLLSADLT